MKQLLAITGILAISLSGTAMAGDAAAGKKKASMCTACHGANGHAFVKGYPHLAGQDETYLIKQLNDFKSGARKDPVMAGIAASLTEEAIADLAAHFSSLK